MIKKTIRIVITGPECTGKSTLTRELAEYFQGPYIPEYARDYIEKLNRPYNYKDVLHIAETQLMQGTSAFADAKVIFFDTYLVITKIWFEVVYNRYPAWIEDEIKRQKMDLYLLCDTSIPWIADDVRENGGAMREVLYLKYQHELENMGCKYAVVKGIGQQRLTNAIEIIHHFFPDICTSC
jgi:NadR type nicotinamide-nucleotide adenylyltransferase